MQVEEEFFGGVEIEDQENAKIPTPASFSKMIERRAVETGEPIMDIIMEYCEETGLEPETVAKLINASLRDKLEYEASQRNMFKKRTRTTELPI